MSMAPTVTVAIPVLNEEAHIDACLDAVAGQTYPGIVEVLVVDGGSTDATRAMVADRPGVRLLENPRRIQAAALNIALEEAKGDVFVRVDGHCVVASDYVERCVKVLQRTAAAMVGGAMTPVAEDALQRGIASAMASKIGAGPARFHSGGASGPVDTVYLGAYRTELARAVGGYATDVGVNEDAEFAIRMRSRGPVWFDQTIRSTYVPRGSLRAVGRQFYRYGRSRAATVRKHPRSLVVRQLAAPVLLVALVTPWRRPVVVAYGLAVLAASAPVVRRDRRAWPMFVAVVPVMHAAWGAGFWVGIARRNRRRPGA
jgi:glycosyltransferase involved in cell wall biosynthesis